MNKKRSIFEKLRLLFQYYRNMRYAKNNVIRIPKYSDIRLKISGKGNVIEIDNCQGSLRIHIPGNGNTINMPDCQGYLKVSVYGNDNLVKFGTKANYTGEIAIGVSSCECHNARLIVGDNFNSGGVNIQLQENNSSITIGNDCMFSWDITIWCTDTHSVINKEDGRLLNFGKSVEIGNHVWLGRSVSIAKNTKISDNSIVGWCSNVTRVFDEANVIIAGNPAQIVKRDVNWDSKAPNLYQVKKSGKETQ